MMSGLRPRFSIAHLMVVVAVAAVLLTILSAPSAFGAFVLLGGFVLVGLSPFKQRHTCLTRIRSCAARRERPCPFVPLVDPPPLLPPQHAGDDLRDPLGARGRRP